jgi:fimbrial chaperone protein
MPRKILLALLGAVVCALTAHAAEFQLNPLRLVLTATRSIDAFRLTNQSDTPVRVQISVKAWSQGPQGDEYADSRDIISNPPMCEVAAKATQTIRVGLRDTKPGESERAYRAFFQEIPARNTPAVGIQTLLRISVPIFVPPLQPQPASLRFSAAGDRLILHNTGNVHVQITKLTVSDAQGTVVGKSLSLYVLPGQTMSWPSGVKIPASAKIVAETDQGSLEGMTDDPHAGEALPR